MLHRKYKTYHSETSHTLDAVLAYIYRKEHALNRCGRYAENVIEGLLKLDYIKKVSSPKGTFYFKTEKSQQFKAIDFAKEYLWHFHNPEFKKIIHNKRYILCFDGDFENNSELVEINEALGKGYV